MKSIARALNNIAIAITNLTRALTPSKKEVNTFPISNTYTTNPYTAIAKNVKITSVYQGKNYYEDKLKDKSYGQWALNSSQSPKIAHVHAEEKLALDAIYKALTDKGSHPDHHDYIMRELSTKWPVLHAALKELISVRNNTYNKPASEIWKNKDKW